MKTITFAAIAAITLGAAAPALAVDTWLFGYSPAGQQLLTDGTNTFGAFDTGWFDQTGYHNGTETNYFVGNLGGNFELRNFFSFNPTTTFTSASLKIGNPGGIGGFGGFNPGSGTSVTWTLYDMATTINTFQIVNDVSIFNDLGTGIVYGQVTVSGATTLVTVKLNTAGLLALNAAANSGTAFNVGGSLSTAAMVPEPASWAMLIAGFGLVGAEMRRRKAALAA